MILEYRFGGNLAAYQPSRATSMSGIPRIIYVYESLI